MKTHARASTESVWTSQAVPTYAPLGDDVNVDVCVVGAGIAGLTTAYLLALAGQQVAVIDDGAVGSGQTSRTSAHLASAIDDRFVEIERLHGRQGARLAAESHAMAIDRMETICQREAIDCEFRRVDGFLFAGSDQDTELLDRELKAALATGVLEVERLEQIPGVTFPSGRCLRFGRQAQFHPLKYLSGLSQAIVRQGGAIYCQTRAASIESAKPAKVTTRGGPTVTAQHVVVATNTPVNDLLAIHSKQASYTSYVIGASIPSGSVPAALYWDTEDPYHYVRVEPGGAEGGAGLLFGGGVDHKRGQAQDCLQRFGRLEVWARARFPWLKAVEYSWNGQVMETLDGLAFIGRNPLDQGNCYVATGDSGMGLTHGTIAGIIITDLILERENRWARLYDPARKPLGALGRFAVENANVMAQYGAWLSPGEVDSEEAIAPGSGAVLRQGLTKLAIYRDDDGQLTRLSAVCPHLKCIVTWNPAGRTWDCPCHGSAFDCHGKVINGPSAADLPPADQ